MIPDRWSYRGPNKARLKLTISKKVLGVLLLADAKAALKYHVFILGIELLMVGWRKHGKSDRAFMDKEVVRA